MPILKIRKYYAQTAVVSAAFKCANLYCGIVRCKELQVRASAPMIQRNLQPPPNCVSVSDRQPAWITDVNNVKFEGSGRASMLSMFTTVNMNWTAGAWNKVAEHTNFSYCTLQYEKSAGFKCYFKLYYQRRSAHVDCERNCDSKTEVKASSVDVDDRWTAGVQWTAVPVRLLQQHCT